MLKSLLLGVGGITGLAGITLFADTVSYEQMAIAGMALVFMVDKLFAQFKSRGVDLPKLAQQINNLYAWHDSRGDDEILKWYVPKLLKRHVYENHDLLLDANRELRIMKEACQRCHARQKVMHEQIKSIQPEVYSTDRSIHEKKSNE